MQSQWRFFPDAVSFFSCCCIDGTPHEIYRPQVEPQAQFYSGHRHYHVMNTQLIVDNQGNIVFLQAGFLSSMNVAGNFILIERIGPGTAYDMPRGTVPPCGQGLWGFCPSFNIIPGCTNQTNANASAGSSKTRSSVRKRRVPRLHFNDMFHLTLCCLTQCFIE